MKKRTVRKNMSAAVSPSESVVVAAARNLLSNPDYQTINRVLQAMEVEILEMGKKAPSEALWSELRGFHKAAMLPENIVSKAAKIQKNTQADELEESLSTEA